MADDCGFQPQISQGFTLPITAKMKPCKICYPGMILPQTKTARKPDGSFD